MILSHRTTPVLHPRFGMSLNFAISQFLGEFSAYESGSVRAALRSLTSDESLIERTQSRLQLHSQLTLIRRMAMARSPGTTALAEIDRVIGRSISLKQKQEELLRVDFPVLDTSRLTVTRRRRKWIPTEAEIIRRTAEVQELKGSLEAVVAQLEAGTSGSLSTILVDKSVHNCVKQ